MLFSKEEYSQLRAEITQLLGSSRTVWLTLVTTHAAMAGIFVVFVTNFYKELDYLVFQDFVHHGGLVGASVILLLFQMGLIDLGHHWIRDAYKLGSYIVVFHERRDAALEWITRNRDVRGKRLKYLSYYPGMGNLTTGIFFVLGLFSALVGVYVSLIFGRTLPLGYPISLVMLLVVVCFYDIQLCRLRKSAENDWPLLTEEWREEWNRVHGSSIPIELQGYRSLVLGGGRGNCG